MNDNKQLKRVVVYITEEEYRKARSMLLLVFGISFSEWVRKQVKELLENDNPQSS